MNFIRLNLQQFVREFDRIKTGTRDAVNVADALSTIPDRSRNNAVHS